MPRPIHPVRTAAAARGLLLRELAGQVDVSPGVLRNVLSGRAAAWPALRLRLSAQLDLDERELFPAEATREPVAL